MQSVNDGVVQLHGKAGERDVQFSISVDSTRDSSPADEALPIHRLAAKAQIKQLEDGEKGSLCCVRGVVSSRAFFTMQSAGEFSHQLFCVPRQLFGNCECPIGVLPFSVTDEQHVTIM